MNITVIGTGYVGLVTGACLAELGYHVQCMDRDEEKIRLLQNDQIPIYEPGLDDIVKRNCRAGSLNFTTCMKDAVSHAQVIFIAVGTPTMEDNTPDLHNVFEVARDIASNIDSYKVIVDKSTVPVGTGEKVRDEISGVMKDLGITSDFDVVSNPEFLREGSAVADFMHPDRIVVGAENEKAAEIMKKVYDPILDQGVPLIVTNTATAEMSKYASNAFLAAKISFINEIANVCELCGADSMVVSKVMGLDSRIGSKFLNPGPGYGGSCFPKDTRALLNISERFGYLPRILQSVIEVNQLQPYYMAAKIFHTLGEPAGKVVTILGAAFKPGTDDVRESPVLPIIQDLQKADVRIRLFDPVAMGNMKRFHPGLDIEYCYDTYSACSGSDCIVLATEWEDFIHLDFSRLKNLVKTPVLVDLRNVYDSRHVRSFGFIYQGVGRI